MKRMRKDSLILVLAVVLVFISTVFTLPARAAESQETVKVGYYENEVFEEGASDGAVKTGYAYEYYRKLSEYTGWNYDYVYGGFSELYDMLLSGEIDMLAGLAKRSDRIGSIGYPEAPMGNEIYTLVRHEDDATVTYQPSSVSGKKIGVLKSAIAEVLNDYLVDHSIEAEVILYDDYESLFKAFDEKEVDVLAAEGDGAYGRSHAETICNFGTSDYYLCVSIDRKDLLDELNMAQSRLSAEEPNYLNTLQNKYYSASVFGRALTEEERSWIAENQSLNVGYLNNYLPYSSTDSEGNVTGILKELLPKICEELSIRQMDISYSAYDNYDDMIADIQSGKLDTCFPVGGGLYYSEENGIYQTEAVATSSTDLVYKGDYDDSDTLHFAVNENNRMQYYYVRTNYPDAEITFYPDIDSCLMAVMKGEVGATTLNGLRANEILKNSRYNGLYLQQLGQTDDRCFGVRIGNEGLLKLLNRGIKLVGQEYAQDIAYIYAGELYQYTLSDLLREHIWLFLSLLLSVALLIIIFVIMDLRRTRHANRLKSDFLSNMSHEIRTPVTAILGMNEMIQRESDDEEILGYADNIEKAGESLLGIINDILDFSKIEAGRMELHEGAYAFGDLLRDLQLMVQMRAEEKGLRFSMEVDENLPTEPVGDEQKLRQIITNLLTNAVKYTEEGEVKLSIKLLSKESDRFFMEVSVEDTGIGIREEEMSKLYSAFDRLDMERNRHIEGSGLGLAITQQLLSLMGSEIQVKSTYGKGSRFFFRLWQKISVDEPLGAYETSGSTRGQRNSHRHKASFTAPEVRLLVVDDTRMNLQVICGLLKDNRMQIDTAESGAECIERFSGQSYDMIFLDQRMPIMDGVETLSELKKRFPEKLKATPVISLTANALSGVREEMLKAGFTDYLTKPVNLSDMEEMLKKYLPDEKLHPAETEDDIPQKDSMADFSSIEGLSVEKGLEYCGDEEDYREAIKIYCRSREEKEGALTEALHKPDRESLGHLLHSLKSTSLAIGAIRLADEAAALEKGIKDENLSGDLSGVSDFIKHYHDLCEALHSKIDKEDS